MDAKASDICKIAKNAVGKYVSFPGMHSCGK
jgi:hypothetical protein